MAVEVSPERFEELVDQALDEIPEQFLPHLENTVLLIEEEEPTNPYILGLYNGVPLTERNSDFAFHLPSSITIFRRSICNYCNSEEQLIKQVRITVLHEVAHHFGIDDEQLHAWGWG